MPEHEVRVQRADNMVPEHAGERALHRLAGLTAGISLRRPNARAAEIRACIAHPGEQ
jgi:hypothetical protein